MFKKLQLIIYNYLEKPDLSKTGLFLNKLLLINLLINLFVVLCLTFFSVDDSTKELFELINSINVYIFILEFVVRFLVIGIDDSYKGILGRVKFLFTPFSIIDIVSVLPHFVMGMNPYFAFFLRFLRIFKLLRFKNFIHKLFNFEIFVTSNLMIQFFILFLISTIIIFTFRFFYGDNSLSFDIFMDPSSLGGVANVNELLIGVIEAILGLIVGGTLISIITETLSNKTSEVKNGFIKVKDNNHILIIHDNSKLEFLLDELNSYYSMIQYLQTVVILLPNSDHIEYFMHNLKNYKGIMVKVATGDIYSWQTFDRLSVNKASKLILLENKDSETVNENLKLIKFLTSHKDFTNENLEFLVDSSNNLDYLYDYCFNVKNLNYTIAKHKEIIQMFLNRSVINIDYFKIFSEFLSFGGCNFYIMNVNELLNERVNFGNLYMSFSNVIVIGVVRDSEFILNPNENFQIELEDKLIYISDNEKDILLDERLITIPETSTPLVLEKPQVKDYKKIGIIGDFGDFNLNDISEFLTEESLNDIDYIVRDEYMDDNLWNEIEEKNYDLIILNLEDEYEFLLTLYIKNKYKENMATFNKIVNILNDTKISELLEEQDDIFNIILSDKISAQFITQVAINPDLEEIYKEITHSFGSEFYILSNSGNYSKLFDLDYVNLKYNLLKNDMLYIGIIKNGEFILNSTDIKDSEKIVVLTEGVGSE